MQFIRSLLCFTLLFFIIPTPFLLAQSDKNLLTATSYEKGIILNWGEQHHLLKEIKNSISKGYQFEGFNIYQLPNDGASKEQGLLLKTFDLVNDVTTISQQEFVPETGTFVEIPVQFGSNSGLQYTMDIDIDFTKNEELQYNNTYYFGLSFYSYNPDESITKTIESPLHIVSITLSPPQLGRENNAAYGDTTTTIEHAGNSTGSVQARIIDPTKITGDDYQVVFEKIDTTTYWHCLNIIRGDTNIAWQQNQSGDNDYLNAEGFEVRVMGDDPGFEKLSNGDYAFIQTASENGRLNQNHYDQAGTPYMGNSVWLSLSAPDASNRFFISEPEPNALRYAPDLFASSDFEIRFTTLENGSYGYWAFSTEEVGRVPFQLWRIKHGASDSTRLIPWLYEGEGTPGVFSVDHGVETHYGYPAFDRIYWMLPDADFTYNDFAARAATGQSMPENFGQEIIGRMLIAAFTDDNSPAILPAPGTVIRLFTTRPNTKNDVFAFSTNGLQPDPPLEGEDLKQQLVNIFRSLQAYPNPYDFTEHYAPWQDYITFHEVPHESTLRIYTLAGVHVKTLHQDHVEKQFLQWDLTNAENNIVGSGVYFGHIENTEFGIGHTIKFAIIR